MRKFIRRNRKEYDTLRVFRSERVLCIWKGVYKRERQRERERESREEREIILEGVSGSIKRFSILNIE